MAVSIVRIAVPPFLDLEALPAAHRQRGDKEDPLRVWIALGYCVLDPPCLQVHLPPAVVQDHVLGHDGYATTR